MLVTLIPLLYDSNPWPRSFTRFGSSERRYEGRGGDGVIGAVRGIGSGLGRGPDSRIIVAQDPDSPSRGSGPLIEDISTTTCKITGTEISYPLLMSDNRSFAEQQSGTHPPPESYSLHGIYICFHLQRWRSELSLHFSNCVL